LLRIYVDPKKKEKASMQNSEKISLFENLFGLKGKVAIVTGGAGRLGVEHTRVLSQAGATVCSLDVHSNSALQDIAQQFIVDIGNRNAVAQTVKNIGEEYGRIDILINNAGVNPPPGKKSDHSAPYEEFGEDLWRQEFDVGIHGAMWCTQAVAPFMKRQASGVIINIASDLALIAPDNRIYEKGKFKSPAYATVKAALLGFTRSWASYFATEAPGVRVNAVCFGGVNFGEMKEPFLSKFSRLNMVGKPALPDSYHGTILYLCGKASEHMTGSVLVIDGGRTAW